MWRRIWEVISKAGPTAWLKHLVHPSFTPPSLGVSRSFTPASAINLKLGIEAIHLEMIRIWQWREMKIKIRQSFAQTFFFYTKENTSCQIFLSCVSAGISEVPTKLTWWQEVGRAGKSLSLRIAVPEFHSMYVPCLGMWWLLNAIHPSAHWPLFPASLFYCFDCEVVLVTKPVSVI